MVTEYVHTQKTKTTLWPQLWTCDAEIPLLLSRSFIVYSNYRNSYEGSPAFVLPGFFEGNPALLLDVDSENSTVACSFRLL